MPPSPPSLLAIGLVLALGFAAGCDSVIYGPDAQPTDECAGDVAAEDVTGCFKRAMCHLQVRCWGLFADEDACMARPDLTGFVKVGMRRDLDAVAVGKITYDGAAAAACFDEMKGAECVDVFTADGPPGAHCEEVFRGAVAEGGSCTHDQECEVEGSSCRAAERCELQCCEGTCEHAEAGSCTSSEQCDEQHWCELDSGSCRADFAAGASCSDDAQCPRPEVCVGDDLAAGLGTCGAVHVKSSACDGECRGPLFCNQPGPSVAGTCDPLPGLGDDCAASKACAGFLVCDGTHTCIEGSGVGQLCTKSEECQLGRFCDNEITGAEHGKCMAPQANSTVCQRDAHCASRVCADDGSGLRQCQAYVDCHA